VIVAVCEICGWTSPTYAGGERLSLGIHRGRMHKKQKNDPDLPAGFGKDEINIALESSANAEKFVWNLGYRRGYADGLAGLPPKERE